MVADAASRRGACWCAPALMAPHAGRPRLQALLGMVVTWGRLYFPDADIKFFLMPAWPFALSVGTKNCLSLVKQLSVPAILRDLEIRGRSRSHASGRTLVPAADAHELDSSDKSPAEVLADARALCMTRGLLQNT